MGGCRSAKRRLCFGAPDRSPCSMSRWRSHARARMRTGCFPPRLMGANARVPRGRGSQFAIIGPAQGAGRLLEAGGTGIFCGGLRCRSLLPSVEDLARTSRTERSSTGQTIASSMGQTRCRWAARTAARRSVDRSFILRWCRFGWPDGLNRAAGLAMARTGRSIGAKCGPLRRSRAGAENRRPVSYRGPALTTSSWRRTRSTRGRVLAIGCEARNRVD